jgi:F0F1-type ATP synthase alpha subunit
MCRPEELQTTLKLFERKGAMPYTCVISALEGCPLGEQYAALSTACSVAERVRDSGGAALVILDDVSCMVGAYPLQMHALSKGEEIEWVLEAALSLWYHRPVSPLAS